jgi:hypothetical protein
MNLDTVSQKHMNELELLVNNLLSTLRKAKVEDDTLRDNLRALQTELEETRRRRFDTANSEYSGF